LILKETQIGRRTPSTMRASKHSVPMITREMETERPLKEMERRP